MTVAVFSVMILMNKKAHFSHEAKYKHTHVDVLSCLHNLTPLAWLLIATLSFLLYECL